MIVTFYSFKGGVGRSMAMANVARAFQLAGLNVVMVDWDLEAPGLETFFSLDPKTLASWRSRVGLMDLLQLYKQDYAAIPFPQPESRLDPTTARNTSEPASRATAITVNSPKPDDSIAAAGLLQQNTTPDAACLHDLLPPLKFSLIDVPPPVSQEANAGSMGKLRMLTAGWREGVRFAPYANAVQAFNWNDFYLNYRGRAYFEWFRNSFADGELADVVLIDSRTGVTEMGGVCTRELADVVVTLAAPNRQNVDGAAQMAASFRHPQVLAERPDRPISVVIVPSRVDVSATEVKQVFEGAFREKANVFMPEALARVKGDFLKLRIPYVSKFAFQDQLSIGEKDGDSDLNEAYNTIAAYIAWLAPEHSRIRTAMGNAFEQVFGAELIRQAQDFGKQFDARWENVPEHARPEVRELLLRLVEVRASPSEPDRARPLDESTLGAAFRAAASRAVTAGLVKFLPTAPDSRVLALAESEYVTQPSLLTSWIEKDRAFLSWRQRLRVFLGDWHLKNEDHGSLLQGSALAEAVEMMKQASPIALLDDEREFILTSNETALKGATARAPKWSTRWTVLASLFVTILVAFFTIRNGYSSKSAKPAAASTDSLLLVGRRAAVDSNYAAAISAYSIALQIDSQSVEALTLRGEAYEQFNKPLQALLDFDKALSFSPTNGDLRLDRARLRWANSDTTGALKDLAALPRDSIPVNALRLQGDILLAQGLDSAALRIYDTLVARNDIEGGQVGRGQILERLGNSAAAVRAYQIANSIASDPSIKTFAQARLQVLKAAPAPTRAKPVTIYLQVSSASDGRLAPPIDSSLRKIGLRLAADKGVNYEVKGLDGSVIEIRYFQPADEALARRVQGAVEGAIAVTEGILYRAVARYVSPTGTKAAGKQSVVPEQNRSTHLGHLEIWLPVLRGMPKK